MRHATWLMGLVCLASVACATPPAVVATAPANEADVVTLPDGTLRCYYTLMGDDEQRVESISSADGGRTWSEPVVEFETRRTHHACYAMVDRDGEVHVFYLDKRGKGKINVDYFIDILHRRTLDGRTAWSEPTTIFTGYTGALRAGLQLPSGRIVVPVGEWNVPDEIEPGTGNNAVGVVYSDDGGATWRASPVQLRSPVYEGYNGANYGAVEPGAELLPDGRIWMLIRTQTGYLYESFSRDGVTWDEAQPSRFYSSNSPAALLRLPDDRVLLLWNNSAMPPRHEGEGVYGGRDALHAAISDDGGVTWRGFREIYRDPTRHDTPPKRGDRGTAYPNATITPSGDVLIVTGQGEHVRRLLLLDPDWLLETTQHDDFANGLDAWSAFTEFGPAERYWRDRAVGPRVTQHPHDASRHAMHLDHAGDLDADGATWNFPAGQAGRLTLRVMLPEGSAGGAIALYDRFFNPTDDTAGEHAVFVAPLTSVPADGAWHDVTLTWDLPARRGEVAIDGAVTGALDAQADAPNGVSYLSIRAATQTLDEVGLWVESVNVEVSKPGSR